LIIIFPVIFSFSGEFSDNNQRFNSRVSLIHGLFRLQIRLEEKIVKISFALFGLKIIGFKKSISEFGKKQKKEKPAKQKQKKPVKQTVKKLSVIDWIVIARKIFPKLLKPIKFKRFESDLTIGFSNPAVTGLFISSYYMFRYTLKIMRDIQIQADFSKAGIFGNIELSGLIHLVQYISILIFTYKQYRRRIREKKGGV